MNVLSLFDGMSCGRIALERVGIEVTNYYASEIDKYATKVSEANYPDIIRLGDVTKWKDWNIDWSSIDLVTGGFPCQAWSMAGKQLGDKDERGMLFWTMLDVMKKVREQNPKAHFLIENVKMKKEFEEYITHHTEQALGEVHKILINSALVSAQNRNRYYWTSFPVTQPEDRGIVLADIIETGHVNNDKSFCIDANYFKGGNLKSFFEKNRRQLVFELNKINHRCNDVTVSKDGARPHRGDTRSSGISEMGRLMFSDAKKSYTVTTSHAPKLINCTGYRKLTPRECFRLQTAPEHCIDKILNSGELYSHSQSFYNELMQSKVKGAKCRSVKSMTVNSQSQVEKLNCAISTTLDSLDTELRRQLGSLSIKANHVPKVGASVIAKLQKGCASSTTKHGSENTTSRLESVRFALKTSEVDGVECVLDTQNQKQNMETRIRLTLTPEENSSLMGIKVSNISKTQTVDGLIELLRKRLSEENCEEGRRYTTLMAINLITAKAIFSFANLEHNTYLCIDSLNQSQCSSLEMGISTLKMENIKPTSNSALYKIAGNGWTVDVIAHLLKCMLES